MGNPFYYGSIVPEDKFCNRREEINELKRDINNGLNILIYSPRRFGKSSLIIQTLSELKREENLKSVYVDLMGISSKDEFINEYFNALAKSLETNTDKIINFFKSVLKIKPSIKAVFDSSGETRFHLEFSKEASNQTLKEVLEIPRKFSEKGIKIAVAFDEFQEIEILGLENIIRSQIQKHSNKVSYIFMGSKKSILNRMFTDKSRAFYKFVKHFHLREIPEKEWIKFIQDGFSKTGKKIQKKYIKEILKITKGFPYYTQQFAYELWELTDKKVDEMILGKALELIMEREEDLFAVEWENLTSNQKKALKLIVEKEGKFLYDEAMLSKYELKIGSLRKTLLSLLEKDIIDKKEDAYYIQDPLFEHWLKKKIY